MDFVIDGFHRLLRRLSQQDTFSCCAAYGRIERPDNRNEGTIQMHAVLILLCAAVAAPRTPPK